MTPLRQTRGVQSAINARREVTKVNWAQLQLFVTLKSILHGLWTLSGFQGTKTYLRMHPQSEQKVALDNVACQYKLWDHEQTWSLSFDNTGDQTEKEDTENISLFFWFAHVHGPTAFTFQVKLANLPFAGRTPPCLQNWNLCTFYFLLLFCTLHHGTHTCLYLIVWNVVVYPAGHLWHLATAFSPWMLRSIVSRLAASTAAAGHTISRETSSLEYWVVLFILVKNWTRICKVPKIAWNTQKCWKWNGGKKIGVEKKFVWEDWYVSFWGLKSCCIFFAEANFSWHVSCIEESENAQPHQHLNHQILLQPE